MGKKKKYIEMFAVLSRSPSIARTLQTSEPFNKTVPRRQDVSFQSNFNTFPLPQ